MTIENANKKFDDICRVSQREVETRQKKKSQCRHRNLKSNHHRRDKNYELPERVDVDSAARPTTEK